MKVITLLKNYKIKLILILLIIITLIFVILPKDRFKENLAQNLESILVNQILQILTILNYSKSKD